MPGAVASAMGQKLPLVGFGPCRRAAPSWVEKKVPAASFDARPGCAGVIVGRNAGIKAGTKTASKAFQSVDLAVSARCHRYRQSSLPAHSRIES